MAWDDIKNTKILELILNHLDANADLGRRMTVEIVESENIKDFDLLNLFLEKLRFYGVSLAIDDFGSGYSNFIYLERIKPDYVKIDGVLIEGILDSKIAEEIVISINNLCHKFNMKTVAEFVSTEEILNKVKEIGIDYSQGYTIDKPFPIMHLE